MEIIFVKSYFYEGRERFFEKLVVFSDFFLNVP
jgi:hypothetical protein